MKKNLRFQSLIMLAIIFCCFFVACSNKEKENISLNYTNTTMEVGDTLFLSVITNSDKTIEWQTSNFVFASVNNGKVTAKKAGTVTITAKQGYNKATCTITINDSPISLNYNYITLSVGGFVRLEVKSKSNAKVKWQTSNLSVATVSVIGWVTAVKTGTAIVTATQGNEKATCKIVVS